jgi:hypothetical protein
MPAASPAGRHLLPNVPRPVELAAGRFSFQGQPESLCDGTRGVLAYHAMTIAIPLLHLRENPPGQVPNQEEDPTRPHEG